MGQAGEGAASHRCSGSQNRGAGAGRGPAGAGSLGAESSGAGAWSRCCCGGGGVMAEAALDAVRRELREFPAAARGEWVRAEAAGLRVDRRAASGRGRDLGHAGNQGPESGAS